MAEIHFTSWLRSMVPDGPREAAGTTVGAALDALFADEPQARGYVLDEQGRLRKHVCIFVDGKRLAHAVALTQPIGAKSKLYVMQALSGG
jgi:molybdopterin synthase sulfur carrier subunit